MRRVLAASAAFGSLGLAGTLAVPLLVVLALVHPSSCSASGGSGVLPGPVTAAALDAYLQSKNSPLTGQGEALLAAGVAHRVDPRFVVAVAGAESSFGQILCAPFNAWGYGCPGRSPRFSSWPDAVDKVSQGIAEGYLAQGRTSVATIGAKWAPVGGPDDGGNSDWPRNVEVYMREQGGDPGNVALAPTPDPARPASAPGQPASTAAAVAAPAGPGEPGLDPGFAGRWEAYRAAVHAELGIDLTITSGYRSTAEQQAIWDDTPAARRGTWVAAPGASNHNKGLAIDHAPASTPPMRALAARLGLRYPMDYEPWHVEPADFRATGDPGPAGLAAGAATASGCAAGGIGADPGPGAAGGSEPASHAGATGTGAAVLSAARSQLGRPYVWGGGDRDGPAGGGFDCSGLVLYAWWQGARVPLEHSTTSQFAAGQRIAPDQVRAGDLLFFDTTGPLGHVGIADGAGGMVHAPSTGNPVQVVPDVLADPYYAARFAGATRPAG